MDISCKIASINLKNPLILASGILDENAYTMKKILEHGASAVVTKSIGMDERRGFETPVIYDEYPYFINAIGLSNPGIDAFSGEMEILRGSNVIGSIFGTGPEDFSYLAKRMEDYGAIAVELNLSCPHVKGFGLEVGSDSGLVESIVSEVKSKVNIPVFAKLSPNTHDILEEARAAEKADALVLINTLKAMKIDINARMPVLSNIYGGLSGRSIKPVGIRYVYEVSRELKIPVIGVGGIENYEDAIEYIMAGASAVEIGTGIYRHGKKIFSEITNGILNFMKENNIESLSEIRGCAIR
ncbi:dihydroorotate dehydrogenase [Picrophilus oshimae]|uniref:Dihydroorotate dehydrogenase n=1 Tax=Picrophilus torridus (strain ATCC 700027 / DSM 9790 / JCM 10055 / NBRC 100828 / KAW 2/3) TaxID=1122961 RepID=Q6L2P2_PICTO|nr:dihydroorotate dehydrogenase [Picrophilus oshimae]AAT42760.1 dihydroorotate dehydrogenase [Picrophilus oshimae DSM 9789]